MVFYFKIGYKTRVLWPFSKRVGFAITSVAIVCENGREFSVEGLRIGAIRFRLATFLNECLSEGRTSDKITFVGHYCTTEHLLLEELWPWRTNNDPVVIDMVDDMLELAADLPDSCFTLDSEYSLIKGKVHESQTYSLQDKLEMIASHPEYPEKESDTAINYARWIWKAYNFKLLQIHLIGRGLPVLLTQGHENDNSEQHAQA